MTTLNKPELFFALGLNRKLRSVCIAAVVQSREEAARLGRERQGNSEAPYDTFNVFALTDLTGEFLSAWLINKKFTKPQATVLVRRIGNELLKIVELMKP